MKKIIVFISILMAIIISLSSCNNKPTPPVDNDNHTHAFGEWIVIKAPTCEADGLKERTCECEAKQSEIIIATGHDYVDGSCSNCGSPDPDHVPGIPETPETPEIPEIPETPEIPEIPACSEGLAYQLGFDGTYYMVTGIGTCADTKVVIPNTYNSLPVTEISWGAFRNDGITRSFVIPESMTNIGIGMASLHPFGSVTEIIVNENNPVYKSIDGNLYTKDGKTLLVYSCAKTEKSFEIPSHVTTIGLSAFFLANNLESIVIPNSVMSIEFYALSSSGIITVFYTGTSDEWNKITIDSSNYDLFNTSRYYYSETAPTTEGNFWHYVGGVPTVWEKFVEPESSTAGLYDDNGNILASWDELVNIYGLDIESDYQMGGTYNNPSTIDYIVRNNSKFSTATELIIGNDVTKIGEWALSSCNWLTSVKLNSGVTYIAPYSFSYCYNLKEITISDTVTRIQEYAFSFCESLESIILPRSLTSINPSAFYTANPTTTNVFYAGTQTEWNSIISYSNIYGYELTDTVLYYYSETKPTTDGNFWHYVGGVPTVWEADNTVYSQGLEFASTNNGTCYISGIGTCTDTDIVIPKYSPEGKVVVAIGHRAFENATTITSIVIPEGVTDIEYDAFTGCSSLKKVVIPASMTYISSRTLSNCTALEEVVFVDPTGWRYDFAPISGEISAESLEDPKTAVITLNTSPISYSNLVKY